MLDALHRQLAKALSALATFMNDCYGIETTEGSLIDNALRAFHAAEEAERITDDIVVKVYDAPGLPGYKTMLEAERIVQQIETEEERDEH